MSPVADAVARGWTRAYTVGLPDEAARRRRAEIASDLHEHACWAGRSPAQQAHVLGRVLWGIPADLSWRRAARAPRERRLETGVPMTLNKTTTVVVGLVAVFNLWLGIGVLVGAGADDGTDAGGWRYGLPLWIAAGVLVYALSCRRTAPRRSTVLIVLGAAAPMAVLYWMAPVFVLPWLAVSVLAFLSEPGRRAPAPA